MPSSERSLAEISPPVAEKHPYLHSLHGDQRSDDYFWLRDRTNPAVIAYLEAENAHTDARMRPTEPLQATLYNEMLSRIQETDLSVPYRKGDFYYYTRTEAGRAYPIYCRKQGSLEATEEVLLDQNLLAKGHDYFRLGTFQVSPNHQLLAYSVDTTGAELYTLYFLDLTTRELYAESIPETYYSLAWGNDSQTMFYTQVDPAHRPCKLFRHTLGHSGTDDLVYHEPDDAYYLGVYKTRSEAYILLSLESKVTSEVHFLDANLPRESFQVIQPRLPGIEYSITHHSDHLYITTNEEAINFKLMKAPVTAPTQENWQIVIPHREDVMISGVSAFADHLVIYEREAGLPKIQVRKLSTGEEHNISFPEPTYEVFENANPEFQTHLLRFSYTSLITPNSIFDYNLDTQARELKKETPVLGGYDRSQYVSKRLEAIAPDGTAIPLSLVYRKGLENEAQPHPLLLTGYGSYGASYPDAFSSNRLSLLDRGVVVAIAHIRGGSEMGRKWYEDGKFLNKKNTFTDFIACAEYLIQEWTSPKHLAISGGSAGGLLMGAVINQRPDLFKAVVAQVPFVDVVTTILDPSLPLSVLEWEEWGNPNDKTYYDYMKSYSPYDNVEAKDYPALLITAGLNDPRVAYWEPAKWAAKLRSLKTDNHLLLLKTNMGAGHGGASGRYERLKEVAFEYAFLLNQWGLANCEPC